MPRVPKLLLISFSRLIFPLLHRLEVFYESLFGSVPFLATASLLLSPPKDFFLNFRYFIIQF